MSDYKRKAKNVEAFIVPEGYAIRITTPESEEIKLHAGDYLVRDKVSGELYSMSREDFESQFEHLSSGFQWYTYPYLGTWYGNQVNAAAGNYHGFGTTWYGNLTLGGK